MVSLSSNALMSSPTNFNIPIIFANSSFAGYDGNCIIGLMYIYLGGNSPTAYNRSLLFDAHSNPFSSV